MHGLHVLYSSSLPHTLTFLSLPRCIHAQTHHGHFIPVFPRQRLSETRTDERRRRKTRPPARDEERRDDSASRPFPSCTPAPQPPPFDLSVRRRPVPRPAAERREGRQRITHASSATPNNISSTTLVALLADGRPALQVQVNLACVCAFACFARLVENLYGCPGPASSATARVSSRFRQT